MRKWSDDTAAEFVMERNNVNWIVKNIGIEDIDFENSSVNSARLKDPIISDMIIRYQTSLKSGEVLPRIIVEASEKGYFIVGGNHRALAIRALGESEIEAYVVPLLISAQREACVRSLNARHGEGLSVADRVAQAAHLVTQCGLSYDDAASLLCVSGSSICYRVKSKEVELNMAKNGVNVKSVPQQSLALMYKIKDEKTAIRLAKIVVQYSTKKPQISEIVKNIVAATSPAVVTKRLNQFEISMQEEQRINRPDGSKVKRNRRTQFMNLLTTITNFLERGNDGTGFSCLDDLQCDEDDAKHIKTMSQKTIIRLKMIAGIV